MTRRLPETITPITPPVLTCADCGGPVPDVVYSVRREPHPHLDETLCYGCASRFGGMVHPPAIDRWRLDWDYPSWRPWLDEWHPAAYDCRGCGRARWFYWPAGWAAWEHYWPHDTDGPTGEVPESLWDDEDYRPPRWRECSPACREHVRRWTRRREPVTHELVCRHCREPFTASRRHARHCSTTCRVAAHRARKA